MSAVLQSVVCGSVVRALDELYSQRKREWEEQNPDATPKEHEQAMQRIAYELGI